MNGFATISILALGLASTLSASDAAAQAQQLESKGDALGARTVLQRAARQAPDDPTAVLEYADFLDRYHDPEARANYEKALPLVLGETRAAVARRLVLLSLLDGDRQAAARYLQDAHQAKWSLPPAAPPNEKHYWISIPGPLASFSRMAAIAPDTAPDDVLPALAHNVITNGYQASSTGEALEATEYMKLLQRYLSQARELEKLAGEAKAIRVETCDSPNTGELLRVLGYRMRGGCGADVVLETVNAARAFLTIDSGFPLAELEQALRTNRPFDYTYAPTRIPTLYDPGYFLTKERDEEFIDAYLEDPSICRLYLALSKLDPETATALRKSVPMPRLKVFAHVLDFFGGMFEIRGGRAIVPGAPRTAATWAELAGVSPDQGPAFFEKLIAKDDGWMASYFDALARVNGPVREYLTQPERMKRFYLAIRGRVTSPGPARPVFRSNTDMMLLTTRLRLEPDGKPHVPGNLEVWKNLFIHHPQGKYDVKLTRAAPAWKDPDDLIEALFALCRKAVENEPLKIYMAISDLNRWRAQPLQPATVDRLAREYRNRGAQYTIFSESPSVSDATIVAYLEATRQIDDIGDNHIKSNAAGTMQALAGLWQILVRQRAIPDADVDATLRAVVAPFATARNHRELFDAGRSGVRALMKAARAPDGAKPQAALMDLLAGSGEGGDPDVHTLVVQDMIRIFEAQRLISLDTLFDLADNLESVSHGAKLDTALVKRLASRIQEIQLPRTGLTGPERNAFTLGYWTERHLDFQRKLNLRAAIDRAAGNAERLAELRGNLEPMLRDTLVGLNYLYYAPPGAQLLLTNPVFVRCHDFIGVQGSKQTWRYTEVLGSGWPSSGGGRLVGSLSGLPYALAEAEQNFLVPTREQALIWGDLVPQMILSAKIPRWWNTTPAQMHWVGLHMRYAESLMGEAAVDPNRRQQVVSILSEQASPARVEKVAHLLEAGDARGALEAVTPAEMFVLARHALQNLKDMHDPFALRIVALQKELPDRISYDAISRAFGTPKPTLTNSYKPELLYLRTFPALMGYSSRIMAESWESSTLYWAALADEVHLAPSQLNVRIPEWTQQTVEKIFATHLEDWPAVLRSLRTVGEDVRLRLRMQMDTDHQKASLQE